MSERYWIGFDLDGTLADYGHGEFNPSTIGEPVKPILDKLKEYLRAGKKVKIFTARVAHDDTERSIRDAYLSKIAIKKWMKKHIGEELEITSCKDYYLTHFYDDRAVQVERNTGKILGKDL